MISIIWRGELNGSVRVWGRPTCEGCKSIDVRRLHRNKLLQPGRRFSWSWPRNGEPTGNISIETEDDAIVLDYRTRRNGAEWKDIRQRIPITWTACALDGRRPWFICAVYANGRYCGRRAAILYAGGDLFACRHCYGLSYASQSESPRDRNLSQAQKVRMRLGGSPSIFDTFPEKPPRMHWQRYHRLRARATAAEDRTTALLAEWLDKRHPNRLR